MYRYSVTFLQKRVKGRVIFIVEYSDVGLSSVFFSPFSKRMRVKTVLQFLCFPHASCAFD